MILFLFFVSVILNPIYGENCPNNKTYTLNCNITCDNCMLGCDMSGSCLNGSCAATHYGNGCNESNIFIGNAPFVNATNCTAIVTSNVYTSTQSDIGGASGYTVVYDIAIPTDYRDPSKWSQKLPMICTQTDCSASIRINKTSYFGVYFTFIDTKYSDPITSLVSNYTTSNCTTSSNTPPTTVPTTTTVPSTVSTVSSPSTLSPPSTLSTVSTASTTTKTSQVSTISTTTGVSSISSTASTAQKSSTTNPPTSVLLSTTNQISTKGIDSTILPLTYIPSAAANFGVLNLTAASKSENHIYITWRLPLIVDNLINYTVTYKQNASFIGDAQKNLYYNISNLAAGNVYDITVSAYYGNSQRADTTKTVCTNPSNIIAFDQVNITNVYRKSIEIVFPLDPTSYTCSKNIYLIGIIETSSKTRRKRAVSSKSSSIPNGSIRFNSMTLPWSVSLDKLQSLTQYTIIAEIYANVDGEVVYYSSTINQQTNGPTDGAIIGIVIGILLLLLLIALLIFLFCCYRKKKQELYISRYNDNVLPIKEKVDENKPRSFPYWSVIYDKMEPRFLKLNMDDWTKSLYETGTMSYVNQNYVTDEVRFMDEYDGLPNESTYSNNDADYYYVKNKTQDIIPYDHNRVKLSGTMDYINASFIDGYLRKKAYITAQSPFNDDTTNDFWTMIYDQNVGQIVMLTETEHGNVTKSTVYWPKKESLYGNISVKNVGEINFAFYDIREFEIMNRDCNDGARLVTQYQFHHWSHNDVPENYISFLDFYQAIKVDADISNGPLVVHCGTGISQSAVYIAFDILSQQVVHESCVNVFRTVAQLRRCRPKVISSHKQYMFIYDLLFESILCGQFTVNTNVREVYQLMQEVNPQSGYDYLQEQFFLLQTYSMDKHYQNTNTKEISFVDSIDYIHNLSYIASPINSRESLDEFWKTVLYNHIGIIVDLKTTDEHPYYIRDLEQYEVTINEISTVRKRFTKFEITVRDVRYEKGINVIIFQLGTGWVNNVDEFCEPDNKQCAVLTELIEYMLMHHIEDKILCHCDNGWSKSGLFLTCFNVALKMVRSKYVMVYNVVKSMKFYEHRFVTSFEQYEFIYIFLIKWFDMNKSMENFGGHYLPGLLPASDHLVECLFTHEQTPVLTPRQKEMYAQSLQSLGSRHASRDGRQINHGAPRVHYTVMGLNNGRA